jgi:L-threonylcarbamoyladenylate synthase
VTERLAPTASGLARAAALLREGRLVAFGTETVYGLGGRAADAEAVARIYAAKGRPRFNPLICHYASAEAAFRDVEPNPAAHALAARFWPGPLTLVLPRRADCPVSLLAGAGLLSIAVRVPAAPAAHALLALVGEAIAAPSANRSGAVSPTRAAHVLAELDGRIDAILDTGPCDVGVESTVLDLAGPPTLLRHGGITREAIEALIGPIAETTTDTAAPRSPGQLASHYAPSLPVRLAASTVRADEALLAFGPPLPGAGAVFQLSDRADLVEAAARLFEGLRALDALGNARHLTGIAAMPIPMTGLGAAINDRLARAAAPRPIAPWPIAPRPVAQG